MAYYPEQSLLEDALAGLIAVCRGIREDQLVLPTPCADWDLRALLEHMTGQHRGMVAALSGSGRDLSAWRPLPTGTGCSALFDSIDALRLALRAEDLPDLAWMPEIRPEEPLPTRLALSAHLVDTVAHGWDVAAAIGVPVSFSTAVLTTVYEAAARIPDGPERDQPAAAFAHALPTADTQPSLAGFLALVGRDIAWSQPRGPRAKSRGTSPDIQAEP